VTAARRDPSVDAFLDERNHPLRTVIDRLRDVILSADPRIVEMIKWGGPTFVLANSRANLATIVLRGQSTLTLFFQEGASLPDPHGLLTGTADHVRTTRFDSIAAIDRSTVALQRIVRDFCDANGGATR
jgi:hypothetical protein